MDARNKKDIKWVCSVDFSARGEDQLLKRYRALSRPVDKEYVYPPLGTKDLKSPPVIVGFGPAGMFAGLILSELGYKPIIIERGQDVDSRTKSVDDFWTRGQLNPNSNVQFGEGGAGTFSDGKLTTRIKDIRCQKVLSYLVDCGSPKEILYLNKPHIGTDILKGVVKNIRQRIIEKGGVVMFNTQMTDLCVDEVGISGVVLSTGQSLSTRQVILGIGHSARDTFELLRDRQVAMLPKSFAVGTRIEHPQWLIDQSQYGNENMREILGAADYALTHQAKNGRAVYTFCMCPGGSVVASASEHGQVVTNGMSEHARDKVNANSALLVNVTPDDFDTSDPLAGMYFQRSLEEKAYQLGGSNYNAPMTRVIDFLGHSSCQDRDLNNISLIPTYEPGTIPRDFKQLLPDYMVVAMQEAITAFGQRINGFDMDGAILTGVETRTSSPIRILRDQVTFQNPSTPGLYPCGEGAGYAGGIVSSAVDGIKCAEKIIEKFKPMDR